MKKTDIATVVLIAAASILIAYFVAKAVIGDPAKEVVEVDTTTKITGTLADPNKDVFNSSAINPAVEVIIGNDSVGGSDMDSDDTDIQINDSPDADLGTE
jgi:hypothetical protein